MGFLSLDRSYSGPNEDPFHGGQRRGLGVAASPAGIRWSLLDNWTLTRCPRHLLRLLVAVRPFNSCSGICFPCIIRLD